MAIVVSLCLLLLSGHGAAENLNSKNTRIRQGSIFLAPCSVEEARTGCRLLLPEYSSSNELTLRQTRVRVQGFLQAGSKASQAPRVVETIIDSPRDRAQGGCSVSAEMFAMIRPTILLQPGGRGGGLNRLRRGFPSDLPNHSREGCDVFPRRLGHYGQLGLSKPTKLKREPKAMSRHPLYGACPVPPPDQPSCFAWMNPKGTPGATTSSLWI